MRAASGGVGAAAVAMALAAAPCARADLKECAPPPAKDVEFVVFLSEPRFQEAAFRTHKEALRFFDRLHEYLDQRRDREMAGLARAPFGVARCEGRIPTPEGSDFTADVVKSLYGRKVVLELWGELDAEDVGGKRVPKAQMNYLLVPVQRGVAPGTGKLDGIHRFHYPDAEISAKDHLDLVSNGDLYAFVATAIGVMAFDGEDYARAHEMLCRASPTLARIEKRLAARPQSQAQSEKVRALRAVALDLAGKAIVEAARRPVPALFAGLQSALDPCATGGVTP